MCPQDIHVPPRDEGQLHEDALRTGKQIDQLGPDDNPTAQVGGEGETIPLDLLLSGRRTGAEAPPGVVPFDIVDRTGGGQTLVASSQVVVRRDANRDSDVELQLNSLGFERSEPTTDAPPVVRLRELVSLYTYTGPEDQRVNNIGEAIEGLKDVGAARAMMTALHKTIVKSTDGPAPTSVTDDPEFAAAGTRPPAGDLVVAVIDTGITDEVRVDGWLNEVDRTDSVDELDVFPEHNRLDFAAGHGTFAAGIVRQVDPDARIRVYRALDTDGVASEVDVADALMRAADDGAHVINLSLGMLAVDDLNPCPALTAAVAEVLGRVDPPAIVASAGNDGGTHRMYPAALNGVVSVAGLQAVQDPQSTTPPAGAAWSTHGSWVVCSAVGEGIVSTFVEGQEDPVFGDDDIYPHNGQGDSWAVWTGTSFAAPQIAGLISSTCREQGLKPREAVDVLFPPGDRPAGDYGFPVVLLPGTARLP